MSQVFQRRIVLLVLAAAFLLDGCASNPDLKEGGHMAMATISGHSEADILRAVDVVFTDQGYFHVQNLDFDKKGTFWETAMYGGWGSGGVWIRMRASLDPAPGGGYILGCDAYRVTGYNEGVMEQEEITPRSHREDCQELVDQVKARLATEAPSTD